VLAGRIGRSGARARRWHSHCTPRVTGDEQPDEAACRLDVDRRSEVWRRLVEGCMRFEASVCEARAAERTEPPRAGVAVARGRAAGRRDETLQGRATRAPFWRRERNTYG
jgi:hypothetical protein